MKVDDVPPGDRRVGIEVHAQVSGQTSLRSGDRVWLTFKRYHCFDRASGARRGSYPATDAG